MDLIERQAAIDAMTNTLWHYPNECYRNLNEYEFAKGLSELGLKSVPSAQPYSEAEIQKMQDLEQAELDKAFELGKEEGLKEAQPEQRWIPCSETIDIPDHEVLCCDRYGEEMIGWLSYNDDQWLCESDGEMMYDPIAWREKPEPYREEGEE